MRIAILIHDEFQDDTLRQPLQRLRQAGHEVALVGPQQGRLYRGKHLRETFSADLSFDLVEAEDFDALVIPGGYAPDRLRIVPGVEDFVRAFALGKKPIAAICRGAQLLISADVLRGRTLACYESIAVDVRNAGGLVVDRPVVIDGHLVSSRKPADLPAFCEALLALLAGQPYEAEQPPEAQHPSLKR